MSNDTATPLTPRAFANRMESIRDKWSKDRECMHVEADELLVEALRSLGYGDGCDIFERMDKWYA